ncbi:nucleolar GTP-binding protein 1 [Pistacia vera]|uniref:nucleolar GTP-binding protein 1 n=1 Tax=Pistacia vera TaxID=55513 RepID=UPI001263384C|nr:nucleolar GTP-binding protein 1 [Pistacia vera]
MVFCFRGGFTQLQLWQIPCSKIYIPTSKGATKYPNFWLCREMQTSTSTPQIVHNKPKDKIESVGAFQKLPMVMPSVDILYSAMRKAKRVSPTKGIANIAKRERNRAAKQLDALMKELAVPLRSYLENFPKKKYLHPYERSLIELTLGDGIYEEVLKKVDALRKKVVSVGKEHASLCAKSLSKREAGERLGEGMERLEDIFNCEGKAVDDLLNIAKTLRAMPVVDLETPTLCLVGAPNVGKSSLVRVLSTGKPEVCNYPFTTRGILMGHITLSYQNFQVTDTPGLLRRSDDDRNNLEKLTLAVLSHLPTAILFVHDLSGECGTSPSDQFKIYKEIKERFRDHLWLDVISKCDLLHTSPVVYITESGDGEHLAMASYRKMGPDGAICVSVKNEEGLDELKDKVHELLVAQMDRIGSGSNSDSPEVVT